MTKAELISKWHEVAPSFKSASEAEAALASLCSIVAAELLGGGETPLPGLGKLKVKKTKARTGRNPRTGEAISIAAGQRVVFSPCKELKDALKG